jgi:hypothetical protein
MYDRVILVLLLDNRNLTFRKAERILSCLLFILQDESFVVVGVKPRGRINMAGHHVCGIPKTHSSSLIIVVWTYVIWTFFRNGIILHMLTNILGNLHISIYFRFLSDRDHLRTLLRMRVDSLLVWRHRIWIFLSVIIIKQLWFDGQNMGCYRNIVLKLARLWRETIKNTLNRRCVIRNFDA